MLMRARTHAHTHTSEAPSDWINTSSVISIWSHLLEDLQSSLAAGGLWDPGVCMYLLIFFFFLMVKADVEV